MRDDDGDACAGEVSGSSGNGWREPLGSVGVDDLHGVGESGCWYAMWRGGGWFAVVTVVANGLALVAALSDGGRGWAFEAPTIFALSGLVAPIAVLFGGGFAIVRIKRTRGRDVLAWVVVLVVAVSGAVALWIIANMMEAVAVV